MIYKKIFTIFMILLTITSSVGVNNAYSYTAFSQRLHKSNSDIEAPELESEKYQEVEALEDNEESKESERQVHIEVPEVEEVEEKSEESTEKDNNEIIEFDIGSLQLREGIASDEIFRIREFLKEKGYSDLNDGYYFDSNLKIAVMKYQLENGLNPDGIIGPMTFSAINNDMIANSISIKYKELILPEDIPKGKWILINKASNTLYHYDNNNLINKYPVASGKTPDHTPEGKFYIVKKFINPYWGGAGRYSPVAGGAPNNPLGKRWLGLNIRGGGSYGIHGNSDLYSIGKYVSLGCIRMFNEDVEYLFDIVEYNTPVWIVNDVSIVGQWPTIFMENIKLC